VSLGHGWVIARPDGARANCGGPAICRACGAELAAMGAEPAPAAAEPAPVWGSPGTPAWGTPGGDHNDHLPGCTREHRPDQVCRMADTALDEGVGGFTPVLPPTPHERSASGG
jgi:hypothetical protein